MEPKQTAVTTKNTVTQYDGDFVVAYAESTKTTMTPAGIKPLWAVTSVCKVGVDTKEAETKVKALLDSEATK